MTDAFYTCGKCGVRVGDSSIHARWHDRLNDASGAKPAPDGDSTHSAEQAAPYSKDLIVGESRETLNDESEIEGKGDIPFIEHTPEAIRKCWHVLFPEDEGSCSSQETEKRNGGKA